MKYKFNRHRIDKISRENIIKELQRVAKLFNYHKFGWREFDKVATSCKSACVKRNFGGSWNRALEAIGFPLEETQRFKHTEEDLFNEMERIWVKLGHRPSRTEWELLQPKIHYNTYKRRFDGWTKACMKFIEYKMGSHKIMDTRPSPKSETSDSSHVLEKRKRDIPLKLRLKVFSRDGFRCVYCGRSPAITAGVMLHIDHIIPVAKGGETTLSNLQTLCRKCNLGKSASIIDKDEKL